MRRLLCLLFFMGLTHCGDSERVSAISALEGDVAAGQVLYTEHCERCHAVSGGGNALGPSVLGSGKNDTISITLSGDGSMPSYDSWTDQEIADCTAYVLSL